LARTVLLADDSVTAQNMGRRILIDAGYEVITVNNGSAALKKIHESRPDLIVLDVYMPGYGGLEVCQRLKESEETNRIPVLLTVGKMEPFKPEEAKRVRADGHIVKPFEASELLAALTRLEDRIVPQAEPSRNRKSKPERKSRGWRVADPAVTFDDTNTDKIAYLNEVKQRHSSGSGDNGNAGEMPAAAQESFIEEISEAAKKITTDLGSEGPKMPRPMSVYAAEQLQELPVVADANPAAVSAEAPVAQESSSAASIESEAKANTPEVQQATVVEPAQIATVESTPVAQSEAAEETPSTVSQIENEVSSVSAEAEPAPADAKPVATTEVGEVSSSVDTETGASQPEQFSAEPRQDVPATTRWVAEKVALTAEEASLELEREMDEVRAASIEAAQSVSEPPAEAQTAAASTVRETGVPETENDETNGATFAAAASMSGSSVSGSSTVSIAVPQAAPEQPVASESSAAWENWQQIRDSVMGAQTTNAIAESVAEVAQSSVSAKPEQSTEASDDADSATLSSIVDSVLAELKPRLMEEISKKLRK
jgi:CheY-like chemotaxis protein